MNLLLSAFSFLTLAGIFSRWQIKKTEQPDLDQQVLDQLKKAGSDLSKPHNIDFFLYFSEETSANQAAKEIGGEVDTVNVQLSAEKTNWLCSATKLIVPQRDELARLRSVFEAVAAKFGGIYDGWGCEVQ